MLSKHSWRALILLVFCQSALSDPASQIDNETTVKTVENNINGASFFTADLVLGAQSEADTQKTKLIVEIQEGGFVVGEKAESGWGIDCGKSQDTQIDSCYYDPAAAPGPDSYRKNPFHLIDGYSFVRLNDEQVIHAGTDSASLTADTDSAERLNIKIIEVPEDSEPEWKFPGSGVMGLSPTSYLMRYLLGLTSSDEMTVTLKYDMQDATDKSDPSDEDL